MKSSLEKTLSKAYRRGWEQIDPKKGEEYLTILNHLAEEEYVPKRMTQEKLAECLGWMQREFHCMVDHMNEIHDGMISLATRSLISQMEKGLFKKTKEPRSEKV